MKGLNNYHWKQLFKSESDLNHGEFKLDPYREIFFQGLWMKSPDTEEPDVISGNDIDYLYREFYNRPFPFKKR